MPSIPVSFESALRSLSLPRRDPSLDDYSTVVSTNLGLTLIEIQGNLSLPKFKPQGLNSKEQELFTKTEIPQLLKSIHYNNIKKQQNDDNNDEDEDEDEVDSVKFGRLEIDQSFKRATLFISTTQRLVGTIEKIDPPLGLLKIDHSMSNDNNNNNEKCEMLDIINTKIIFKQRPLPIM
jgi:chromosome transmission fidelity protein 8